MPLRRVGKLDLGNRCRGPPGADWWVAGPTTAEARHADVELGEVEELFTQHGLWDSIG